MESSGGRRTAGGRLSAGAVITGRYRRRTAESLHQAAKESMQEWLPDALEELRLDVTGTFLEELDEQNQEVEFRELMTNSVWYVLLNRCGLDAQEYLDAEDFRHITDFNQLKILGHLGSAVNEISRPA